MPPPMSLRYKKSIETTTMTATVVECTTATADTTSNTLLNTFMAAPEQQTVQQ